MLQFNPYLRPSAKDLLKNKIFDPIRIKENEISCTTKIKIKVDYDVNLAVNYEENGFIPDTKEQRELFLKLIVEQA
jgi:hypothetical protein